MEMKSIMTLKNNMEFFVQERLDRVLKQYPNACRCEKCRMDIIILALNNLPGKYVNTRKGDLYTRLDSYEQVNDMKIVQEIARAIEVVSKNPRH